MPQRSWWQDLTWQRIRHSPGLTRVAFAILDAWFQIALFPFRRYMRVGEPHERQDVVDRTDELNTAARAYYMGRDESFLSTKPFSEPAALPKHLIDTATLIRAIRLLPGHTVLELGAGSCWLSHFLNRLGCPTVAVDVSASVLAVGHRLFMTDPHTRWDLHPAFVAYDGHALPLRDTCIDRVVISDAFHHIPNQREVLLELARVLRPDGILAMSEPGRGHGDAASSRREVEEWAVLENELVIEDVAALATSCGFCDTKLVLLSPLVYSEIQPRQLGAFMGGKGFARYWKQFCGGLERHHYLVCFKGDPPSLIDDSQARLARIDHSGPSLTPCRPNVPLRIQVTVTNIGTARWLGGVRPIPGWTRLGAHLARLDGTPDIVAFDWWRGELPATVSPGESIRCDIELPGIQSPGRYRVTLDLVVEGVTWFETSGSVPLRLDVAVGDGERSVAGSTTASSDNSRDPWR